MCVSVVVNKYKCVKSSGWRGKTRSNLSMTVVVWVCLCVCWHGNTGASSSQGNSSCLLPSLHQYWVTSCLGAWLMSTVAPLSHPNTHIEAHSAAPSTNTFISSNLMDPSLKNHAASHCLSYLALTSLQYRLPTLHCSHIFMQLLPRAPCEYFERKTDEVTHNMQSSMGNVTCFCTSLGHAAVKSQISYWSRVCAAVIIIWFMSTDTQISGNAVVVFVIFQ